MSFPNDEIDKANKSFNCISSDQADEICEYYNGLISEGKNQVDAREITKEYISAMRDVYIYEKLAEEFEALVDKAVEEGIARQGCRSTVG